MKVNELIETIGSIRKDANQKYKEYKNAQVQIAELKEELWNKLNESGLKSAKGENYGVSIAEKRSTQIENESSVIQWLKDAPNVEEDAYIGLKLTAFKKFADGWFKETGEIIEGTESVIKESITIRENKK